MFAVEFDTDSLSLLIAPQDEPAALDRLLEGDSAFVWGLLINPRLIRELTGHWLPFAPARIEGYRRSVLRDGDRLDLRLEPESGSCVDGVLLLGLSREDRAALDRFERAGEVMRREPIECLLGERRVATSIYLRIQ